MVPNCKLLSHLVDLKMQQGLIVWMAAATDYLFGALCYESIICIDLIHFNFLAQHLR